jgi:ABC-type uncharacterized transport system auxiliary subunit
MHRYGVFTIVLSASLLGGCAMTEQSVVVDYSPGTSISRPSADSVAGRVLVGRIEDKRGLANPNIILHKENLYGDTMSGAYLAEKPVAEIVRGGLAYAFGSPVDGTGTDRRFELYGSLLDFDYETISGFWTARLNSKMSVQLYLREVSTKNVVWNETFIGRGHVEKFSGSADAVDKMLSAALDDLIPQVQQSESLNSKVAAD